MKSNKKENVILKEQVLTLQIIISNLTSNLDISKPIKPDYQGLVEHRNKQNEELREHFSKLQYILNRRNN